MRKLFTRLSSILVLLLLSVQLIYAAGPQLASTNGLSPADGSITVSTTPTFTMTFASNVVPGVGGTFGLYKSSGDALKVIQIVGSVTDNANGTVTFSGNKVTISFKGVTFSEETSYYVKVEGLAIKNSVGENFDLSQLGGNGLWDFTTGDFQAPKVATVTGGAFNLTPRDNATGVPTSTVTSTVVFNENVRWVSTDAVGSPTGLQLGDIALYEDTGHGEEGGDLVSLNGPVSAVISGTTLTITWAAGSLEPTTNYYIRIKGGLIEDEANLVYAGINNNSGWNFTTASADKITPAISANLNFDASGATNHASGDIWTNDNFFIDFGDVLYISKGVAVDGSHLPSGITLVDDGGNPVPFTLSYDAGTQTFKLDPYGTTANAYLTGQSFTVTIPEGVVRTIDNKINAAKTATFNRGDWTAPTFDMHTTNYSGTTFDIMVENASEACKIAYIVVAKDQAYFKAPTLEDILGYNSAGSTYTNGSGATDGRIFRDTITNLPAGITLDGYTQFAPDTNLIYAYEYAANKFRGVEVFATGVITVNNPALTVDALERVINLPATNGKYDYMVYGVAYDDSDEGLFSPNFTGRPLFASSSDNNGNIGSIVSTPGETVDILMPTVWFDGDSANYNNKKLNKTMLDGAGYTPDTIPGRLARKGHIYLNFNEGIRMANNTAIANSSIPSFLHIYDGGTEIGFEATLTPDKKQIIAVPDSAYKSNNIVRVVIDATEIEDLAGNEFQPSLDLRDQYFQVESYQPVLALFDPEFDETAWDGQCIDVRFNRVVYVPRDDEPSQGSMQLLVNDPTSPYWAGKYFEIREGDDTDATNTDPTVKSEFDFNVTYTATETKVTICRVTGTWESETWYWVWAEGQLLDENRYELVDGYNLAHPSTGDFAKVTTTDTIATTGGDNQTIRFMYEDTRAPEVTFYQADLMATASRPSEANPTVLTINGATNVGENENIGVLIDEYVTLGFADHIKVTTNTSTLTFDNNAMRRYFRILHGTDTLEFDVRAIHVAESHDHLWLELDPYYISSTGAITEKNFTACETYTVQFISTDLEGVANGAYEDDNDNWVVRAEATFTVACSAPAPTLTVAYSPMGTSVSSATNQIVFTFNQLYTGNVAPIIEFDVDGAAVPMTWGNGVVSGDYKSITYDITGFLTDTETYRVTVGQNDFGFHTISQPASSTTMTWPTAGDSTWTFTTIDGTPPVVYPDGVINNGLWLTPVDNATGVATTADLVIRFDENVLPVAGKNLFLWESGVSEILRIPATSCTHIGGDSIKVPNSFFGFKLKYNTAYHVIIEPGFVTDMAGNAFAGISQLGYWNFTTGSEPAIAISSLSPTNGTVNLSTPLSITFNRAATPQVGAVVAVYDITASLTSVSSNVIGGMTSSNGGKTWTINGFTPVWGHEYTVSLTANAFRDSNNNPTPAMVAGTTGQTSSTSIPRWVIRYMDTAAPTVKFWPTKKTPIEEHIPYNAYLYIQFNEPIAISDGSAVITDPSLVLQNIDAFISLGRTGNSNVAKKVEFVDNDKRTIRVTPLDPIGHDYTGDDNPTMATDSIYTLTVNGGPISGLYLVDTTGMVSNAVASTFVQFRTEDITKPVLSGLGTTAVTSNSVKVQFTTSEKGNAYVYVVAGTPATPSSATVIANAQWTKNNVTGSVTTDAIALGNTEGSKTYSAFVVVVDDEVDTYANPDPSLWIFTSTTDGVDRIRDILPAPNTSVVGAAGSFSTCDDDDPYVIAKSPAHLATNVAVTANVYLTFNENIAYIGGAADSLITLRKAKNNAQVPATVTVVNGDSIRIQPSALEQETDYYVEIDRYAVTDVSGCSVNRASEEVGKDFLFFSTIDVTAPIIDSTNYYSYKVASKNTCIDPTGVTQFVFYITEKNSILKDGGSSRSLRIYRGTDANGVLLEVIPIADAAVTTGVVDGEKALIVDVSGFIFLGDDQYYVEISAGSVKDNSGNAAAAYGFTFSTLDNIAPMASWEIYSMNYYFNNSTSSEVGIKSYWTLEDEGDAGETAANASSNSMLKISFDEAIQIKTSSAGAGKWVPLSAYNAGKAASYSGSSTDNDLSRAEIFNALHISGLVYNDDTSKTNMLIKGVTANSILIAFTVDQLELYNEATIDGALTALDTAYVGSLSLDQMAYTVTIDKDEIADIPTCPAETRNLADESAVVTIETRDDNPPMLEISACEATCNSATGEITLTFDKPIVKSSYDIVWLDHEHATADNLMLTPADISKTGDGRYIELSKVGGDSVVIKNITIVDRNTIKITPNTALASNSNYKIVFNKWTVKEYIENDPSGALFEGDSCVFHVYDYKAPVVTAITPKDIVAPKATNPNGWDISASTGNIVVSFDEKVRRGSGTMRIRRENGQIFEEIDAQDAANVLISADKKTVTLKFKQHTALEDFTMYYVEMPAGFITDTVACADYNDFGGFSAQLGSDGMLVSAGWNFKTSDGTPPELLSNVTGDLVGLMPVPGDVNVPKNSNLVMTFDENISTTANPNAGIVIYHNNGDSPIPGPGEAGDFGNAIEFIPWGSSKITISGSDIYNGFTSDVITVNPTTEFTKLGTYYVRVTGDNVMDVSGNLWSESTNAALNEVNDYEWYFTITNDVAPVLVATDPTYDGVAAPTVYESLPAMDEGYVIADLSMTFEDGSGNPLDVVKGDNARKVRIYEYYYNPVTLAWDDRLWLELPITDESITINGNVVTLNDVVLRDGINGDSVYYVTVDPGAILNGFPGSQTFWQGIANGFRWRFQTDSDDVFVAGYEILSPNSVEDGDDARNLTIADASTLEVSFNEGIEALAAPAGMVKVYDADADSLVEAVTVTPAMCSGNVLTVPLTKLYDETNFYVVVEEGAFGDTSTISTPNFEFGGVDVWAFHTGDNTAPVPVAVMPADGDDCVASDVTLTLTFDETFGVLASTGSITVTDGADYSVEIAAEELVIEGNTVTAVVTGLPDTSLITVTVSTGVLLDGDAHSPLANPEYTWSFMTGENTVPTVVSITPVLAVTPDTVLTIVFSEIVNATTLEGTVMVNGEEVTVTSLDGITYTAAIADLPSETVVDVTIAEGAFVDVNAGCTANEIAATDLTIEVADIAAPTAMYYPATAPDYMDLELSIVFDDAVAAATGDVMIYDAEEDTLVTTIAAADFVTADDTTFTYVTSDLYYGSFYVMIDAGSFVDATAADVAKEYAGIADMTTWTIDIVDTEFDDCIAIISPLDGTTNVPTTTDLVLEFCTERIVPGSASKFVTVAKQSNVSQDAAVETAVDASMISVVDGKYRLTIKAEGLEEMTTYSVIIAPGAITDEAGNAFAGIIDANAWNFTTVDATAPVVTLVPGTVTNEDGSASMTRDEAGAIYLVHESVPSELAAITAAVTAKKAVASLVTTAGVNVTVSVAGLVPGEYRAVAIDASGNVGESADVVTVEEINIPEYTIAEIQGNADESPFVGQVVTTKGVVTVIDANGYYIQDANTAWSGIYVFDKANNTSLNVGAGIQVTGEVDEFGSSKQTELKNVSIEPVLFNLEVVPVVVSANTEIGEEYESMRVTVEGVSATEGTADKDNEWTIASSAGSDYTISLYLYKGVSYDFKQDFTYAVTGIVYSNYKVEPVFVGDIVNLSELNGVYDLVESVKVYPNPFNEQISIKSPNELVITKAVITNTAGQIVKEVINPERTIATGELREGVYFISLHTEVGIATERIIKR